MDLSTIFDGIGTAIVSAIIGVFIGGAAGGTVGYKIGVKQSNVQKQKGGAGSVQLQNIQN